MRRRFVVGAALAALIANAGAAQEKSFALDLGNLSERQGHTLRVIKGDRVRILLASNHPVDVHLHGYGIEARAAPGQAAEMLFVAHRTGRFPIEIHRLADADRHRHPMPFAYLEVWPK